MGQVMTGERSLKSDDDLIGLLESGPWTVRAGPQPAAFQLSLRDALQQARDLSTRGIAITYLASGPDEAIVIGAVQVCRLWQRLGMIAH
jgi:hypothetical protein